MMKMETPADACAAMAAVVVGADGQGTEAERRYLFETISEMRFFEGMDRTGVEALVANATDWIWSSFPTKDGRVTEDGVTDLAEHLRDALNPTLRLTAFEAALELARADGLNAEEARMLHRLRVGLDIDEA